ncbi:MAG TPA: DUF58 domain-containing protein [Acidimicrobiales bacterium]|nr:DUF58 domain-containing protein [Acidimicrobiales bacterium]
MPTRRGWATAAGAVALVAAGRIFGIFELFVLGAGAAGLLVAGAVAVLVRQVDLDASRTVHPTRVHVGADSRVELAVTNLSPRPSPVVAVRDTFTLATPGAGAGASGRRHARFLLAPVGAGGRESASYRLPADHRGIFAVGPLEAEVTDAFGLWSRVTTIAPSTELTVYPTVETLAPAGYTRGDDPTSGVPRPASVGPNGEDLYGLRPYEMGDDLRRVHWPSTARTGELVVRQLELPWQGRATVLLDLRDAVHTDATLETAVSAAASILAGAWRQGALVRLITTDGTDSGFAPGHAHFDAVMEHLAIVSRGGPDGLDAVLGALHRPGNGGGLTAVTTAAALTADADVDRIAGLRGRFASPTIVAVEGAGGRAAGRQPAGVSLVRVRVGTPLATSWNRALAVNWVRPTAPPTSPPPGKWAPSAPSDR